MGQAALKAGAALHGPATQRDFLLALGLPQRAQALSLKADATQRTAISAAFDRLIKTLQEALGLTVFLITHDLDTLYAICDRVAVLAGHKVVAAAPLPEIERLDHPWIREYFHGPRARAARGLPPEHA